MSKFVKLISAHPYGRLQPHPEPADRGRGRGCPGPDRRQGSNIFCEFIEIFSVL